MWKCAWVKLKHYIVDCWWHAVAPAAPSSILLTPFTIEDRGEGARATRTRPEPNPGQQHWQLGSWSCQVAGPGFTRAFASWLLASFAAFELPPRYTLACYAFMAALVLFPLCQQVLFLQLRLLCSSEPFTPGPPHVLLSLGFYCMFYGNFKH